MGIGNIPLTAGGHGLVMWTGTIASIPSGFTRDTDFDQRFYSGAAAGVEPGTNGGATAGTHTPNSHNHNQNSHSHTLSITGSAAGAVAGASGGRFGILASRSSHTHSDTPTQGNSGTNTATTGSVSNSFANPALILAIILKPDDGNQKVPVDATVYCSSSQIKKPFFITDGNNGTDDVNDRYFRAAVVAQGGGSQSGENTHTHNVLHSHVISGHIHADSGFGISNNLSLDGSGGPSIRKEIHHQATSIQAGGGANNTDATLSSTASSEPVHKQLLAIQNKGSGQEIHNRMVIAFTGLISEVPNEDGWFLMNGDNGTFDLQGFQVKTTTNSANIGISGGSNTHTHTILHGHTSVAHNHTYTFSGVNSTVASTGSVINWSTTTHTHSSNSMGNTSHTNTTATITMSTDDSRALFREVLWIQLNLTSVHIKGTTHIKGETAIASN